MTTQCRLRRTHPTRRSAAATASLAILAVIAGGCGNTTDEPRATDGAPGPRTADIAAADIPINRSPLDTEAKASIPVTEIDAIDPQFPMSDPSRFATVVLGKVLGFADGPTFVDYEGDTEAGPDWVVMKVEPVAVLRGEEKAGDPIYVQLTLTDPDSLAKAIPPGTFALVAAQPVNPEDDKHLADPFAGVPEGRTRYIAGAPYAAIADGPSKTWYPVLGQSYDRPITDLVPADLTHLLPADMR